LSHDGKVTQALDELVQLLDLERIEVNMFRGRSPDEERQRVFGGQVAAQSLVAAGRTVDEQLTVHSLHAYFLRPGDMKIPILYDVDRIRDGRSFATRRVVAIQHGEAIFNLAASFHRHEEGVRHARPMPTAPDPESLPDFASRHARLATPDNDWVTRPRPFDLRHVSPLRRNIKATDTHNQVWFKADGVVPDDPLLHSCLIAYASDMTLVDTALLTHDLSWEEQTMVGASLDHVMWFHDPIRPDGWMLYDQESTWAGGGRGISRGEIYSADGQLCVSVVQECLMRPARGHVPKK
jgi:acyl-CoA thioesterase II